MLKEHARSNTVAQSVPCATDGTVKDFENDETGYIDLRASNLERLLFDGC